MARIEYGDGVLTGIEDQVQAGFRLMHLGGIDVGGLLYGVREGDSVRVTAFAPIPCEHAFGTDFILSRRDLAALEQLLHPRDAKIVGWYRSRTRTDIHLSRLDQELFDRYFPEPWQIALVLHPENFGPSKARTFFRGDDEPSRPESLPSPAMPVAAVLPEPRVEPKPGRAGLKAGTLLAAALGTWLYFAVNKASWPPAERPAESREEITSSPGKDESREPFADRPTPPISPPAQETEALRLPAPGEAVIVPASDTEPARVAVNQAASPMDSPARPNAAAPATPRQQQARARFIPPAVRRTQAATPLPEAPLLGRVGPVASLPIATPAIPPAPAAAKPAPVRRSGVLIWTGRLDRNGRLRIQGGRASLGAVSGALPGGPVRLRVYPAELTASGIQVYSADRAGRTEPPGPRNGWNQTTYVQDPRLAGTVRVLQSPSAANGWGQVDLEAAGAAMSVVLIEWESL